MGSNIQLFIDFANFEYYCIKDFNKIIVTLISMLKTILLATLLENNSLSNIDFTNNKMRCISIDDTRIGKKNKNLSKTKNIKELAISKKLDFIRQILSDRIFLFSKLK